ncbi:MAG TPA: hypothetical protein VGM19_05515 [Armatimonadota bacterium]|jgi:hypothetical protein
MSGNLKPTNLRFLARSAGAARSRRGGQALVLVVLLMMAVILVGILFVAVVTFNQESSTRLSDVLKAGALAEAGLRYADYMITNSPEGADWRPPFKPYDPVAYKANDPATWPVPPVYLGDPAASATTYTATAGMFGPDNIQFTDDDQYMQEEADRGWAGMVNTSPPGGGPTGPYYVRRGYTRYPDPSNAGGRGTVDAPGLLYGTPADQVDFNQGHFLLRVTYDPGPPFEGKDYVANGLTTAGLKPNAQTKYLKIECIGVSTGTNFVWRRLVAYKAIGVTDYMLWVTDKEHTGQPTQLGFGPFLDMSGTGTLTNRAGVPASQRGDFLTSHFVGPMRFDTPVSLSGDNAEPNPAAGSTMDERMGSTQLDLVTEPLPYDDPLAWRPEHGGYLRADRLEVTSLITEASQRSASPTSAGAPFPAQSTTVNLVKYDAAAAGSPYTATYSHSVWDSTDGRFKTSPDPAVPGKWILDGKRSELDPDRDAPVSTLNAPDLFQKDPATGISRYLALTRDSGGVMQNPTTKETVNVGRYGHGRGVYIDNFADVQFLANDGSHDLGTLMEDWLGNLSPNDARAKDSGWNATRTTYSPRGVEITLYNTENAALDSGRLTAVTAASPGALKPNEVWWPNHVAGQPGMRITRHDRRWRIADPNSPNTVGDDSGVNVMYVDYPNANPPLNERQGNPVIYAEGNLRIQGMLPKDTGDDTASGKPSGRYSLTVVAGGTIYVDGQILSPQDVEGRFTGAKAAPVGIPDEQNTYIALLARDCVVVNPTHIVPQLTEGAVVAAPDNSVSPLQSEQHWQLSPRLSGGIFSRWYFGAPPQTNAVANLISLVAYQTGEDPGPAGLSLWMYNSLDNGTDYYDFDPTVGNPALGTFIFAPSGGAPVADNVAAAAISPLWAPFVNGGNPALPWPLNGPKAPPSLAHYLSTVPGDINSQEFRYSDPGLGGGGSNYWLKKFKIEELNPTPGTLYGTPQGAVHAKVNAVMYAQEGCFFVIPGQYFDVGATGDQAPRFRRYNYDLEIRGAISENFHASPAAWREWQDHWAYPQYFIDTDGNAALAWGTINYRYDDTLVACRVEPSTQVDANLRYGTESPDAPGANLPKLPLLPTCPGLIYHGTGP